MIYKTSKYFISLILFCLPVVCFAQQYNDYNNQDEEDRPKEVKKEKPHIQAPLFNGLYVGVDLYGYGAKLLGSDFLNSEVQVGVNLKNRFMPTVEIGHGRTDTWNENGIHYKSSAPYFRVGVDYNMRFKKLDYEDWLFLGLRYGYSNFKYNVNNMSLVDPIYGGTLGNENLRDPIWGGDVGTFDRQNMKGSVSWYELVGGVRAKIFKNLMMSWTIRVRYKMGVTKDASAYPWYIPGYGKYDSKAYGITYSIIYKFNLGAKAPIVINPTEKKDDGKKKITIKHPQGNAAPFTKK